MFCENNTLDDISNNTVVIITFFMGWIISKGRLLDEPSFRKLLKFILKIQVLSLIKSNYYTRKERHITDILFPLPPFLYIQF